jgi:non-ribosomal peptide synthetase component F
MHHIISDGWSMGVLVREVGALYEAYSRGEESPLEELQVQYGDYAVWQREYLRGEVLEEQMEYWREQLRGVSGVLEMPTDRVRPAVQSYRGASIAFMLEEELCGQLTALMHGEGVTLFMLLLTAFQTLLYRYSRQSDIVVGSPVAGRTRGETEQLIGFFVNTLALRARLNAELSFRDLLKQVRQVCLDGYAHQEIPFEKIVEELAPERAASHTPLYQVMFALQNVPQVSTSTQELKLGAFKAENETAKYDLTLVMVSTGKSINGSLEYNTDLFDEATIEKMTRHFQRLLQSIVAGPDSRLKELEMLTEAESLLLQKPLAIAELDQGFSF